MRRKKPEGYSNVGRATVFGNPVKIGATCPECGAVHRDAESTLACFTKYATRRIDGDAEFAASVRALHGKRLWCPGCGVDSPTCHARVLEMLAKGLEGGGV